VQRDARSSAPPASLQSQPISQAFPIVKRALKVLAEREVSPQTGLLKSTLLQLDSTFSERNYGSSSFLDFTEKLSQAGLVLLKTSGRSVMVELNPDFVESDAHAEPAPAFTPSADAPADRQSDSAGPAPQATASQAEGVAHVGGILNKATGARWPMYIRNVKQIIRAADGSFDERRYGFGGLMDLLRAVQKEGFIRMERDRRGGLRVFPGQSLQRASAPSLPQRDVADETHDEQPLIPVEPDVDAGDLDAQPAIDPTAELLGRAGAKPRRTRTKAAPEAGAKKKRAAAPKRGSRSKKSAGDDDNIGNQ
jgi:hypothetical protein